MSSASWWRSMRAPVGLVALSIVPLIAGAVRLRQIASHAPSTVENERFVLGPVPIVLHIVGATLFALLGAVQFAPTLRLPRSRWHRWSGRIALPAGMVTAATGLWMTTTYRLPPSDNAALFVLRVLAGVGMVLALGLSLTSVYERDFVSHRAWSARGYALGMGAGTQVLTHLPFFALGIEPTGNLRAFLMGVAWLINLLVAETYVQRKKRKIAEGNLSSALAPRES